MTSTLARRIRPLPDQTSQFFWDGARENKLLIQRCDDCSRFQHPPRPVCQGCLGASLTPTEVSGRGTVYTYTTTVQAFHPSFADRIPYLLAVIELAEQPHLKLLSNLVECDEQLASTGMAVEVVFEKVDEELTLPLFRPVGDGTAGDDR